MNTPIDVWMVFQVVAATKDAAEDSLNQHVEKIGNESCVSEFEPEMDAVEEVENPHEALDKGYSKVCEIEMTVSSFSELIELVINYGPTSVDVLGPDEITMDLGEVRNSMNAVAQMMHQFLQAGAGGMMISREQ